jgi:predicted dehydrogenase
MTRRTFSVAAATALSAARVAGANDTIQIGLIGAGGRGRSVCQRAAELPKTRITAVCDVNPSQIDKAKTTFAQQAASVAEFGALLARGDVDAVIIGSPDHWHVPMVIASVQAGKDVYVEKPLTHNIPEGADVIRAVEQSKRVVQVGYQQRSTPHYSTVKDLVAADKLGSVNLAETYWYQDYIRASWTWETPNAEAINWKGWQGAAAAVPFDATRLGRWRWFWAYGGGHLTDLFSHWVDSVHWILGDSALVETHAFGAKMHFQDFECPDTISLSSRYSKGQLVTYQGSILSGRDDGGIVLRGSQGVLTLRRSGFEMFRNDQPQAAPPAMTERAHRDGTVDHVENWLDCVRTRKTPNSNVRDAVAAANAAHWGNRSYREGKRLTIA